MSIHDGVVNVADDDIPVIIELDDDRIRLSASGREIGDWGTDECQISHLSDATFAIRAENETLEFIPSQPSTFAAAVNGGMQETPETTQQPEATQRPATTKRSEPESEQRPGSSGGAREAPPPKPLTMGLFYALCVATAALAIWSLVSILF